MEIDNPLFTVIILAYNNSQYIYDAIDSVLLQKYNKIELIISDDCSTYFPQKEIEEYIEKNKKNNLVSQVVYSNKTNLGTVKNANNALSKAKGEYIKLLASDDVLFDENTLINASKCFDGDKRELVLGTSYKCNADLSPIKKQKIKFLSKINSMTRQKCFRYLCVHNEIPAGSVFFNKSFFHQNGYFDESYILLEDWPTWLEAIKNGHSFYYEDFGSIKYRADGGIGTGTNNKYLNDKKTVLNKIIKKSKKELGLFWYLLSLVSFCFINSKLIRKTYSIIFR